MEAWQAIPVLFILLIAALLMYCYLYFRALTYLGVDLLEYMRHRKDHQKVEMLVLERITQRLGLALWRLHSNLATLSLDEGIRIMPAVLENLKNSSAYLLAIDWRDNTEKGNEFAMQLDIRVVSQTDEQRQAVRNIEEIFAEIVWLRRISYLTLVFFAINIDVALRLRVVESGNTSSLKGE